jgi:hypothetical protein
LPCLIRRAALRGLGDNTQYTISDLRAQVMDTMKAEGQQVRSFQYAAARLKARPELAPVLIHKPGPLYDHPERFAELADVYRRGLDEVAALLQGVTARPN